jgi:excisionase family DNA binding protein
MTTNLVTHPLLLGILEAAALAGVSRSFLYERLADGSISSVKAGRRRLVIASSLNQWVASLPIVASKQAPSKGAVSA